MKHAALVAHLSRPEAWPDATPVEVVQTHGAVVFLTTEHAYKIKRPVNLGFFDFTTFAARKHFVEEEVRLNAPRAPGVYLGVHPLVVDGELVDHAVKMRRLPDDATLEAWLGDGRATPEVLRAIGARIAAFHADGERGPHISPFGASERVGANARENFDQSRGQVPRAVLPTVHAELEAHTEAALTALGPLMDARAARGVPRDTHGDLRVDHVYLLADPASPDLPGVRLAIIDCIEFNTRFRYADPVSDLAFLAMDLGVRGHRELADALVDGWVTASGDREGLALLPFYIAYRSIVRAKVWGFMLGDDAVPPKRQAHAQGKAQHHWSFALGALRPAEQAPALVGVGGLPGTGKSTVARGLSGFTVLRTDVVRDRVVAGAAGEPDAGRYAPDLRARVYDALLADAEAALRRGERVVVDASLSDRSWRARLEALGARFAVPVVLLECRTSPEIARQRIAGRRGDASEATPAVYDTLAARWDSAGLVPIDTSGTPGAAIAAARVALNAARIVC
jgi:aminoglycoside phosphotransferase family enzyme/predicted kinase